MTNLLTERQWYVLKDTERHKYDSKIQTALPVGSYCVIPEATNGAQNRIYKVLKHWEPGEKQKSPARSWYHRNKPKAPTKNTNKFAETQVVCIVTFDLIQKESKFGKTTYASHRLHPIDIVALGKVHLKIQEIIKLHLENCE